MKHTIKNIIIANDAEAFESIIKSISDDTQRLAKIQKEHFLSSRFLFWESDNKIVITPLPIEHCILDYAQNIGYCNIQNWFPSKINISLSKAILEDKSLLKRLEVVITENPGVILSPYCYTKDFSHLTDYLYRKGYKFAVDQKPLKGCDWLINYLGSKVGFRIEMEKINKSKLSIPTPEFFIASSRPDIVDIACWFYTRGKSCVIKAFSGEGGWGIVMVRKENYVSRSALEEYLNLILTNDTIWSISPYIVEELISSVENDQNSPSVEVFVDDNGPKITYLCNQLVNSSGWFMGIQMGSQCIEQKLYKQIQKIGKLIGRHYYNLGYRGFFDIDFIVSKDGTAFPIETNVRRTGGTHVYDLTKYLFGKEWNKEIVVISKDSFEYKGKILSASAIQKKMAEILFPINNTKEGVLLISVDNSKPTFSFVVFAQDKLRAMDIYNKLTHIWKQDNLGIQ